MNLNYFKYSFARPFHTYRHKALKKSSSLFARDRDLYKKAIQEIAEYTNEDVVLVDQKCKNANVGINGKNYDAINENELNEFYINDRHYLYELPAWNAGCGRSFYLNSLLVPYLKRNNFKTILDFGGGTGDVCMGLKEAGFNMHYYDVNRTLIDFSAWRFKKRKLDIKNIDIEKDGAKFDCVISFDVFEHLKGLPGKVKAMGNLINPGGSLIFNIELSGDGLHLSENKVYEDGRKLDKMLRKAGFAFDWKFKRFFFYKKRS